MRIIINYKLKRSVFVITVLWNCDSGVTVLWLHFIFLMEFGYNHSNWTTNSNPNPKPKSTPSCIYIFIENCTRLNSFFDSKTETMVYPKMKTLFCHECFRVFLSFDFDGQSICWAPLHQSLSCRYLFVNFQAKQYCDYDSTVSYQNLKVHFALM